MQSVCLYRRIFGLYVDFYLQLSMFFFGTKFGVTLALLFTNKENLSDTKNIETIMSNGATFGSFFWFIISWILNYGVLQGLTGSSIGKLISGTHLVNTLNEPIGIKASLLRSVFSFYSFLFFGLGFFIMFFNNKKQTFHDIIYSTLVLPRESESHKENKINFDLVS